MGSWNDVGVGVVVKVVVKVVLKVVGGNLSGAIRPYWLRLVKTLKVDEGVTVHVTGGDT